MKKLLIISPYFPPANAADMHRVRISIPYFEELGFDAEVVSCHPQCYDISLDELLLESIPEKTTVHYVKAFSKKITSKLGLGSLALRSLWFYRRKVNQLLKERHFDLIYFSTTQFPVCILGAYWKKKFGIPYVIDMQDPWHTDYYKTRPKQERPPKYWFSYRLNKYLEPIAMKSVDGLIAVTESYLGQLEKRYSNVKQIPKSVITFGYTDIDLEIAKQVNIEIKKRKTLVYIGVLGIMMHKSLDLLFNNLPEKLKAEYQILFKGTSYATADKARKTTESFQKKYLLKNVEEQTDRIGMFQVIKELSEADGLLIIGTDDPAYTASKLYPYLQVKKPILAILHQQSNANKILKSTSNAIIINLNDNDKIASKKINLYLKMIEENTYAIYPDLERFSAQALTQKQCELFRKVIK